MTSLQNFHVAEMLGLENLLFKKLTSGQQILGQIDLGPTSDWSSKFWVQENFE